jgi:hypothetical protein
MAMSSFLLIGVLMVCAMVGDRARVTATSIHTVTP